MFWDLEPRELEAVFELRAEEEEREALRFGLVAASIYNANRMKGQRLMHASDFVKRRRRADDYMSVEEGRLALNEWAVVTNARYAKETRE